MYPHLPTGQLSFPDFYLPFSGQLSSDNRWVRLAALIPWADLEGKYACQFDDCLGAPAKPFRMALGALIIQERLGLTDRETVEQITENPYLQYFLGLSEYQLESPFDASTMVHFRKRLSREIIAQINDIVVSRALAEEAAAEGSISEPSVAEDGSDSEGSADTIDGRDEEARGDSNEGEGPATPSVTEPLSVPRGKLILDATCAPIDIHYPTDLGLLNQAREQSEQIIDKLYAQVKAIISKKPRTYRQEARKVYLSVAKQRRPKRKQLRRAIDKQLGYLQRNLSHIDELLAAGASASVLSRRQYRTLLVISEVYRQQREMSQQNSRRIDHRIVSISQPHVRPIVRGKAGTPVEFGAKLSVGCHAGYVCLDELSWENFNEVTHLQGQVEKFRTRYGHYPQSVHGDRIYRSRENIAWCKERGIRLCGPPLGRPPVQVEARDEQKKQARQDEIVRIEIEGKFGQAKRRFSLNRVMAKQAGTAESRIAMTFLVMNLERWLRCLLFCCFCPGWLRRKGGLGKVVNGVVAQIVAEAEARFQQSLLVISSLDPVFRLSCSSHTSFSASPT